MASSSARQGDDPTCARRRVRSRARVWRCASGARSTRVAYVVIVALAEGEHFHVRYGHMYLDSRGWWRRRPRWEERWKDTRWDLDTGRTPEGEWERLVTNAQHHGHTVAMLLPEQLGPYDLYAGRFVPENPRAGEEHVRIYRCSSIDCPQQRRGGF